MRWLDMLLRRHIGDSPEVPDRTEDIQRAGADHARAAHHVAQTGILSRSDERIRRAMVTTGRAIRADGARGSGGRTNG